MAMAVRQLSGAVIAGEENNKAARKEEDESRESMEWRENLRGDR